MLLIQFLFENLHFAINVFGALVFFAVGWLYLDAWFSTKGKKELLKIAGFLLLSISLLIHATYIEQSILTDSIFSGSFVDTLSTLVRIVSYLLLIVALLVDPIQKKPVYEEENVPVVHPDPPAALSAFSFVSASKLPSLITSVFSPILSFFIFILYLRRSTVGLEKHLRPLTIGFFFIFLSDFFSISKIFEGVDTIAIYNIVKPLGPVWFLSHFLFFIGLVIIGKWVFQYLLKRLQTQFFMILNICILAIFLVTTLSFTFLLLKSLQKDALSHLATDLGVVQYSIKSKEAETLSDAQVVSQNVELQNAIIAKDTATAQQIATSILIAKKQAFIIVLDKDGQVLARGEDADRVGNSLSDDSLFKRAVKGEKVSTVVSKDGPIAPIVSIRSGVPIVFSGETVGAVIVGTDIDNAFVDGLKSSTNLDISIYGGNILAASTFVAADGKSRFIGVRQSSKNIDKAVLSEGKNYSGELSILNVPYFVSFSPLKDVDGSAVGMLFAGAEQSSVIKAASKSIEYTFLLSAILILLSVIPSFLISRFITNQFK